MKTNSHRRPAAAVTLDRFASAKKTTYNKKEVVEKKKEFKLRQRSKLRKLKQKLESEGKLQAINIHTTVDDEQTTAGHGISGRQSHQPRDELQQRALKRPRVEPVSNGDSTIQDRQCEEHQQVPATKQKLKKHVSQLQRMSEKIQAEKLEKQQAYEEAKKAREERAAKLEAAQKHRKKEKALYFKKTRSGQPVMKYRIDKMLSVLESEATQKKG